MKRSMLVLLAAILVTPLHAVGVARGTLRHQRAVPTVTKEDFPRFPDPFTIAEKRVCTGYSLIGCMTYESMRHEDFAARFWYHEHVAKYDQEAMTRQVCWNFCRNVTGASAFGLEDGRKCFCSPLLGFNPSPGGLGDCDAPCEGDSGEMCGGMEKADVYEMHDCTNLPPTKCTRPPPYVEHAQLFESQAYYGALTPCKNYQKQSGDNLEQALCDIECEPGYYVLDNSIACTEKGNRLTYTWGQFEGSAVCAPKNCGAPPTVKNARGGSADVYFPDTAEYTCKLGYTINGWANGSQHFVVNCTENGVFSAAETCYPVKCGEAVAEENSKLVNFQTGEIITYGQKTKFKCEKGYTLDSTSKGKISHEEVCKASGQNTETYVCKPVVCGSAPVFHNALRLDESKPANNSFIFPENLTYQCAEGHSLTGHPPQQPQFTSSCEADGYFSVERTPCQRISCGQPPNVANSYFEAFELFFKDNITYECRTGHTTNAKGDGPGHFTLECGPDGVWTSAVEECVPVNCGQPPAHVNAVIKTACPRQDQACTYLMEPTYECHKGYSTDALDDPDNLMANTYSPTCMADGKFSPSSPCIVIDVCNAGVTKTCDFHGTCKMHSKITGIAIDDYSCECNAGYEEVVTDGVKTCRNINDCPLETSFAYECGGTPAVGKCKDRLQEYICECEPGYTTAALKNPVANSTCIPQSCGALPPMPNSVFKLRPYQPLDDAIQHTATAMTSSDFVYLRPHVEVSCEPGFELASGNASFNMGCRLVEKQVTMTQEETCDPVSCGYPERITFATIVSGPTYTEELFYSKVHAERTINYTCVSGYTTDPQNQLLPDPSFTVECLTTGQKSQAEQCFAVSCGVPQSMANAQVEQARVLFPEMVSYRCDKGHSTDATYNPLKHISPITCQSDAKFTDAKPCVPMNCGPAPRIENARIDDFAHREGDILYPTEVLYVAKDGYSLDGQVDGPKEIRIKCTEFSNFSQYTHLLPLKPIECGLPPDVQNAGYQNQVYVFQEVVDYECHDGYSTDAQPATPATKSFQISCLATGDFEAAKSCKAVVCPTQLSPAHASAVNSVATAAVGGDKVVFPEVAEFECNPGYTLTGTVGGDVDFMSMCQADSTFEDLATCSNADDCAGNKCDYDPESNGTCLDHPDPTGNHLQDYSCGCPDGFTQEDIILNSTTYHYCKNIPDCPTSPKACLPGTCEDLVLDYACHCPTGYFITHDVGGVKHDCGKQDCGTPPVVANATSSPAAAKFEDKVTYTCDEGFTLTGEVLAAKTFEITCEAGVVGSPDGKFTDTEVCKPIICPAPPTQNNAQPSSASPFPFPEVVTYTCDTGYSLDRSCGSAVTFTMTCDSKGKVVHTQNPKPTCESVLVGEPTPVMLPNANFNAGKMYFGDSQEVTCKRGYSTNDRDSTQNTFTLDTQANCTFASYPTCVIMKCPQPTSPDHTTHQPTGADLTYEQVVTYTTEPGYTLNGKADGATTFTMTCQDDGTWTDINRNLPVKPVECGAPPTVQHSTRLATPLTYEETVTYTCNSGYSLDGKPAPDGAANRVKEVTCLATGKYSDLPTCQPVECPAPPAEDHATVKTSGKIVFQGMVDYGCNDGWSTDGVLDGNQDFQVECQADGTYTEAPKCLNMNDCANNKCGAHGKCKDKRNPTGVHFDDYECECDSGFQPEVQTIDNVQYHICGNIPDCPPDACNPGNCKDLINDYKCECPTGYYVGPENHNCLPQSCGAPPTVDKSTRPNDDRVYMEKTKFTCDTGHTLSGVANTKNHFEITCEAGQDGAQTGVFSATQNCLPVGCGSNTHNLASPQTSGDLANLKYGDVVAWTCDNGHSLDAACNGNNEFTETCSADGTLTLSQQSPLCQPVIAGTPDAQMLPHAHFQAVEMAFGSSQLVTCVSGYVVNQGDERGELDLRFAQLGASSNHSNHKGRRAPDTSFTLTATDSCGWERHPTCEPINCGTPQRVTHSTHSPRGSVVYPNSVTYTAETGYTVDGTAAGDKAFTTQCLANGNFEPTRTFQKVRCGEPQAVDNSDHTGGPKVYGDTVTYTCDDGHSTNGQPAPAGSPNKGFEVTCTETGAFTALGECKPVECPSVPTPANADLTSKADGYVYDEPVAFRCKAGYTLDAVLGGPTTFSTTCQEDGQFESLGPEAGCKNANNCVPDTLCKPGGSCVDSPTPTGDHLQDYTCSCDPGFRPITDQQGGFHACENIDDCPGRCGDGNCQDLVQGYECSCPLGYYIKDKGEGASANKDETCKKQSCGIVQTVAHATFTGVAKGEELIVPSSVTYTCDGGFTVDGSAGGATQFTATCRSVPEDVPEGSLTGMQSCLPVKCGAAPDIKNSSYEHAKGSENSPSQCKPDDEYVGPVVTGMKCHWSQQQKYRLFKETRVPDLQTCYNHCKQHKGCTQFSYNDKAGDGHQGDCMGCIDSPWERHANFKGYLMCDRPDGLTGARNDAYVYGDKIKYTCDDGHSTTGTCGAGDNKEFSMTCLTNGKFEFDAGSKQSCKAVLAGQPTAVEVPHATFASVPMYYPEEQTAQCINGYETHDSSTSFPIKAQADCTLDITDTCGPITCAPEPNVEHASKTGSAQFDDVGLTYTCHTGHTLDGEAGGISSFVATCEDDGSFAPKPVPECKRVTCGTPPTVAHATPSTSDEKKFGDMVDYTCEAGYTKAGPGFSIECSANGTFTGQQKCVPVTCVVPPQRANSMPVVSDGIYEVSHPRQVKWLCNGGFSTDGAPAADPATNLDYHETCQATGQLSQNSNCKAIDYCIGADCGQGTCLNQPSQGFGYTCQCNPGYASEVQIKNGKSVLTCREINECTEVLFGDMSCENGACVDGLDKFTCNCNGGYVAKNWPDERGQTCEGVVCPDPPHITNSTHQTFNTKVRHPQTVDYQCEDGFNPTGIFGDPTGFQLKCEANAEYSGVEECKPVECATIPAVTDATHDGGAKEVYQDVVTYTCTHGYTTSGEGSGSTTFSITCGSTGTFNAPEDCQIVNCGPPPSRDNTIQAATDAVFGTTITYVCEDGYSTDQSVTGPKQYTATCEADGSYDIPGDAQCMPVQCCALPQFDNSLHSGAPQVYMDSLLVTCSGGYTITGEASGPDSYNLDCNAHGQYDLILPAQTPNPAEVESYILDPNGESCHPTQCCLPPAQASLLSLGSAKPRSLVAAGMAAFRGRHHVALHQALPECTCQSYDTSADPAVDTEFCESRSTGRCVKVMRGCDFNQNHCSNPNAAASWAGCQPVSCGVPQNTAFATAVTTEKVVYLGSAEWQCIAGYSVDGLPDGGTTFTKECEAGGNFALSSPTDCTDINYCHGNPCGGNGRCEDCTTNPAGCTSAAASLHQSFLQALGGPFASNGDYACHCNQGYEVTQAGGPLRCTEDDCHGRSCGEGGTCIDLSTLPEAEENAFDCQCQSGYVKSGEGESLTCVRGSCEDSVEVVQNANFEHFPGGRPPAHRDPMSVIYGDTVKYTCVDGYSTDGGVGDASKSFTATCHSSLVMQGMKSCIRVVCDDVQLPTISHATVRPANLPGDGFYRFGDDAWFDCDAGHTLDGTSTGASVFSLQCEAGGHFTSRTPSCRPISCGTPNNVGGASASTSATLTYGQSVTYTCKDGYRVNGQMTWTSTCEQDGKLGSMQSGCSRLSCGEAPLIADATSSQQGQTVNSLQSIWYQCKQGFSTSGADGGSTWFQVTCQEDGTWARWTTCKAIIYRVEGTVKDASASGNSGGLSSAKVTIDSQQVVYTNGGGKFSADVAGGTHSFTAEKSGYVTSTKQVTITSGIRSPGPADFLLSRTMPHDSWRIVLVWEYQQSDLDSWTYYGGNINCPSAGQSCTASRKVGWTRMSNTGANGFSAMLEVDDVWGPGHETTYLEKVGRCTHDCALIFKVHNYKESYTPSGLVDPAAKVYLYNGDSEIAVVSVKEQSDKIYGTHYWVPVFTMDLSNGNWWVGDQRYRVTT